MQYFAHTRKACGPIALALVLGACGEEASLADIQAGQSGANGSLSSIAERNYEQLSSRTYSPTQSIITAQFSTPSAPAPGNPATSRLHDGNALISAPTPNARLAPGAPVASRPVLPVGDILPVQPPLEGVSDDQTPTVPVTGGDPIVTLIAKSNSGLNSSGTQLEWSAENVDQCQTSGAWEGAVANSGVRHLVHEQSGEHTYMISCRGPQGTAMAMVTVTVESTSLAWEAPARNTDGTELRDLAGYNLYYGTEPGRYTQVRPVRDASKTELELPVEPGTYYLAMTAYDLSGNESALSNEIVRTIY